MMKENNEVCPICVNGMIKVTESQCPFCNGTNEYTPAAGAYLKNHICQCVFTTDRKMCPICNKKCHHDTPNRPKILIAPS